MALGDVVLCRGGLFTAIETLLLAELVGLHHVEEYVTHLKGGIEVDDHVAVHDATLTAATVDITAKQTAGQVVLIAFTSRPGGHRFHLLIGLGGRVVYSAVHGVPLQIAVAGGRIAVDGLR